VCHQSVGLLARHLEAAGLPTVVIANLPQAVERLRPPRALTVRAPRGQTVGPAGDVDRQSSVVRRALRLLAEATSPGTVAAYEGG